MTVEVLRPWIAENRERLILDPTFSASSFGFRPERGAHDAPGQAREYVAEGFAIGRDRVLWEIVNPLLPQ